MNILLKCEQYKASSKTVKNIMCRSDKYHNGQSEMCEEKPERIFTDDFQ